MSNILAVIQKHKNRKVAPTQGGIALISDISPEESYFKLYHYNRETNQTEYSPVFMALKRLDEEGKEYFRARIEDVIFTFQHTGDLGSFPLIPIYSILEIEASDKYRTLQDCLNDCYEFDLTMERYSDEARTQQAINFINDDDCDDYDIKEIDQETAAKMLKSGKIYDLHLYYRTSVGSIRLYEASLQDLTDRLIYFYHNDEIWPSPLEECYNAKPR